MNKLKKISDLVLDIFYDERGRKKLIFTKMCSVRKLAPTRNESN